MDFKLTQQQRELQETARNFAQKEMVEVAQSMEQTSEPLSKEWLKKYSDMDIYIPLEGEVGWASLIESILKVVYSIPGVKLP